MARRYRSGKNLRFRIGQNIYAWKWTPDDYKKKLWEVGVPGTPPDDGCCTTCEDVGGIFSVVDECVTYVDGAQCIGGPGGTIPAGGAYVDCDYVE